MSEKVFFTNCTNASKEFEPQQLKNLEKKLSNEAGLVQK